MNRIDRLTGILLALQTGARTSQQLADRFEISRRTILRDIDALSQLHVPVIAISGPQGGYRLPPDYFLQPIRLSSEEATIVMLALSSLGLPVNSPLGSAHRVAREKVLAILNRDVKAQAEINLKHLAVVAETEDVDHELLDRLRGAAAQALWVQIVHTSKGIGTRRTIQPEMIYLSDGHWYVRAIDHLRRARRTFRLSRTSDCRPAAPPSDAAEVKLTAMSADDTYGQGSNPEVVVNLTPRGRELALDHHDFRDRISTEPRGNVLRFRCPQSELPFYARELLRFGTDVSIESPQDLIAIVVDSLAASLTHHQKR